MDLLLGKLSAFNGKQYPESGPFFWIVKELQMPFMGFGNFFCNGKPQPGPVFLGRRKRSKDLFPLLIGYTAAVIGKINSDVPTFLKNSDGHGFPHRDPDPAAGQ